MSSKVSEAAARKAAMTRHHGATHPATIAASNQHANAKLTQALERNLNPRRGT